MEAIAMIKANDGGGLDQGGSSGGGKWSDSDCILKVELAEFVDGLGTWARRRKQNIKTDNDF